MARALALVEALARRLRPHAPGGIAVQAEAGGVAIFKPGSPQVWSVVTTPDILDDPEDDRSAQEKIKVATYSVLDHFQDFIAEELAEPWPETGSQMALPKVEVGNEQVRMWFELGHDRVLELEPIPLAELE